VDSDTVNMEYNQLFLKQIASRETTKPQRDVTLLASKCGSPPGPRLETIPSSQPVPAGNPERCGETFEEAEIQQPFTSNISPTRRLFFFRHCSSDSEFNDSGSDSDFGNLENDQLILEVSSV